MLMLSMIESGKPSEQKKMRSFLRGFLQPSGNDKLQHEIKALEGMFEEYVEGGNPDHLLAAFAKTDIALKA
ncbi:VHS1096 protein [Vibrio phage 1]|nr:VHS1096 protein [Vibrio phage 1]